MATPFDRDWTSDLPPKKSEPAAPPAADNNLDGSKGPPCQACSGLGEVMATRWNSDGPGGGKKCADCRGSGVQPLTPEEQREILRSLRDGGGQR